MMSLHLQQKNLNLTRSHPATRTRLFDFAGHSIALAGFFLGSSLPHGEALCPAAPSRRVAFIATPHLGSVDAVESMIRGETVLFGGQKELRKLARTFPGVYELLPQAGLMNTVVDQNDNPLGIFDINNRQKTVITPDPNDPEDFDVEQARLTAARGRLERSAGCHQPSVWTYGTHSGDLWQQTKLDLAHSEGFA
jgi:hypothetical protein